MSHGHMDPLMILSFLLQSCTLVPSVHGMSVQTMDSIDGMDIVQQNTDDYYSDGKASKSVWERPDWCSVDMYKGWNRIVCEGNATAEATEIAMNYNSESSRCFGCGAKVDGAEYHTLQFESIKTGQEMRIKDLKCWKVDWRNRLVDQLGMAWVANKITGENNPDMRLLPGYLSTLHAREKAEGTGEASLPLATDAPVDSSFGGAPLIYYHPFNKSRYADFGTYNTILLHPSAKATNNTSTRKIGSGSIVNAAWYHPMFCAASPNNYCGLGSGTGGNLLGGWGLFLAEKKFTVATIDVRDIHPTMARQWRLFPFKIQMNDFEMVVHWPESASKNVSQGAFVTFEFENYAGDQNGKYSYIRNYVLNPQQQNGAFVETHPFPHIFAPMKKGGGAKIMLARPMKDDTVDTDGSFYAAMSDERPEERHHIGRFEFLEFDIPYGYGLVIGSNVMHSDSATEGPLATLLDLNYKGANSAKMHIPTAGNNLTSIHDPTMHKLFNPFSDVVHALESGCGTNKPVTNWHGEIFGNNTSNKTLLHFG